MTEITTDYIFTFNDYKAYLVAKIQSQPRSGRGFRASLAEQVGCQKAFISQVLQGNAHFNLEHGDKINTALAHSAQEAHFFLLLIQYARAGTSSLKKYFHNLIEAEREKRHVLKSRIPSDAEISFECKNKYYSSWIYGAIRVGLTIPSLSSIPALAKHFSLTEESVRDALHFLEENGLVERNGNRFSPTARHLHLENESNYIVRHHTNWRLRALDAIAHSKRSNLHYSAIVSVSKEDAEKIRALFVETIDRAQRIVKNSPEETLYAVCADVFAT